MRYPSGEIREAKLKIKGTAAVGSELSADYTKVTPEGLSDDYVSFSWSRKTGDQLTEVGTEKTYKLTADDLGNKIQLKITGKSELGVTGELKANTVEIVATPEELRRRLQRIRMLQLHRIQQLRILPQRISSRQKMLSQQRILRTK